MQRFVLVILACFWAFMGFRLWQVEYGGKRLGAAVNIAVVWDKVLTAQDEAPLSIVNGHTGEFLGWVNWAPSITRDDTVERAEIVGMVDTVLDYSLDLERGRLFGENYADDLRFRFHLGFGPPPQREWIDLQVILQQNTQFDFEFHLDARATNDFMTVSLKTTGLPNEIKILYSQLAQPQKLVGPGLELAGFNPLVAAGASALVERVLKEEKLDQKTVFKLPKIRQAHFDLLPDVRTEIKVYRVDVPIGNSMFIKIYISMLGEVLRVEIPEFLMDAVRKTAKLDLPKSIILRNDNYYGRAKRRRNR